jgi:hypothetical protein
MADSTVIAVPTWGDQVLLSMLEDDRGDQLVSTDPRAH